MSDEKPAEMSFSDWKKMKSALNSTEEKTNTANVKPKKGQPKKNANNYNNNRQNNNNNYANNRGNNFDFREQQRLQYLANLKQNQMLMMQAALSNMAMARNNMGPFNNNMGAFNNNFGPFNNNRNTFNNNMNPFNNNNMNQFNYGMNSYRNNMGPMPQMQQRPPPLMAQRPFNNRNSLNNRVFTDNFMGNSNEFVSMSDIPIPQQPFRQNKNIPPLIAQQPPKQNKNIPSLMSIRMQKRGIPVKKSNEAKTKETNSPTVDTNEVSNEATAASTSKAQQKKSKNAKQKKNWLPNKPSMPPPIIALTPEAQEAKQRMWREYRQNIKPFKNKDFLNAKRVIQRLKKKPLEELDEKEKERWEKANEFVNSHKKMLSERAITRGEAASARATRVQKALHSENNQAESPKSVASPSNDGNSSSRNSSGQEQSEENSNELPTSSDAAATSENWELWSSFVPGGVLFNS